MMDKAQEEWLRRQVAPPKKLTKRQQAKADRIAKLPKREYHHVRTENWLEEALEMTDTAITYAMELSDPSEYLTILEAKRTALLEGLPKLIQPPTYDPYFYAVDISELFNLSSINPNHQNGLGSILWQEHLFPRIRGQAIGGADESICHLVIEAYLLWAQKTIRRYGPKYLEAQE